MNQSPWSVATLHNHSPCTCTLLGWCVCSTEPRTYHFPKSNKVIDCLRSKYTFIIRLIWPPIILMAKDHEAHNLSKIKECLLKSVCNALGKTVLVYLMWGYWGIVELVSLKEFSIIFLSKYSTVLNYFNANSSYVS